jgi:fumarylacetoacetate (FAA) hydrolase
MKLVSFLNDGHEQLGILYQEKVYNLEALHPDLPNSMGMMLGFWDAYLPVVHQMYQRIVQGDISDSRCLPLETVKLLAPVTQPTSCRDGYAFRQHVEAARKNRGVPMIPEFDQYPIFYFTNHNAICGPGPIKCMPDHFQKLDFELEVAIVICKHGRNIRAADADQYIGGFMIMNDMSARLLQMEEMMLNLGPAKGKDFCTAIGPVLVTPDELSNYLIEAKPGHIGNNYNLKMTCKVNGIQVSAGNMGDMDWTFAEIIERCSYGVDLLPGDIIGSGTVGTGCFLELNGTGKRENPNYQEQWLLPGDTIEMEIEQLGVLKNTIEEENDDFSLLALKKNL